MFKTCISQLFSPLFSLTKTYGSDRTGELEVQGAVGRGAGGEEPRDAPGGAERSREWSGALGKAGLEAELSARTHTC